MTQLPRGFDQASLDAALGVAIDAADAAERIHRAHQGGGIATRSKSTEVDLVTEADTRSEAAIREIIAAHYPDHAVLGEEAGQDVDARCRWIVDPLDGTVNYAHGFPFYCVSLALEIDGEVVLGVVKDTAHGERFTAVRGRGAYLDGRRLTVSDATDLRSAMVSTGFAYDPDVALANVPAFERALPRTQALRRAGAAALDICYVAAGRVDAFWELRLNAWDVAAALLIVREAGGTVTAGDGSPYRWDADAFVASNGALHARLLSVLQLGDVLA
jgi:myo-inositol-1(or 4)-monophosphatase